MRYLILFLCFNFSSLFACELDDVTEQIFSLIDKENYIQRNIVDINLQLVDTKSLIKQFPGNLAYKKRFQSLLEKYNSHNADLRKVQLDLSSFRKKHALLQ